jgi:hypothetical protein
MTIASSDIGLPADRESLAIERELAVRLSAAAVLLLAISPLAAFGLSGFMLLNLSNHTPRQVRWMLGLVLAISMSLIAGARPLDFNEGSSNDILGYHELYLALSAGDMSELLHFGGGFEVALPLLMLVWATVLPPLSVNGLMFCLALSSSLLVLLWIETAFYEKGIAQRPALLGLTLILLNIYFATQLSRQFLSLIVLLFAFTATTRTRRLCFIALAASLHLTALPFYGLWLLARRGWPGWLGILAVAWLLRVYFVPLLAALDIVPDVVADKLQYYVDIDDSFTDSDIASLRMVILLALLSLLSTIASGLRPARRTLPWLVVPWLTAAVHYILLPIPLASLRATMVVHSVASGWIAWQMFPYRARGLRQVVPNLLLLYKVAAFAAAAAASNLRPTMSMLATFIT